MSIISLFYAYIQSIQFKHNTKVFDKQCAPCGTLSLLPALRPSIAPLLAEAMLRRVTRMMNSCHAIDALIS